MGLEEIDRQQGEWQERAQKAQALAAQAYERLLRLAERSDTGQAATVARFVASTFDGQTFPFDPFDLRRLDVELGDDMLICLDALRWGKADLHKIIPDVYDRILAMCRAWNLRWPESD